MDDIERLDSFFEESRRATPVAVVAAPPREEGLLDSYKPRVKPLNVVWYVLVMLVATALWSYVWNPVLNYIHIWSDPPKGVTGYGFVALISVIYTSLCMALTVAAGAAACARQFRPAFTNAILLLAMSAAAFIITMELSTGKPWASLLSFFG